MSRTFARWPMFCSCRFRYGSPMKTRSTIGNRACGSTHRRHRGSRLGYRGWAQKDAKEEGVSLEAKVNTFQIGVELNPAGLPDPQGFGHSGLRSFGRLAIWGA